MRIAWLTPLNRGSGISRYSLSVVSALSARDDVEVVVWHSPTTEDLDCPLVETHELLEDMSSELANYDAVFYNLGNHFENHASIYDCYRKIAGIVVLHDKVMQGFFFGYANEIRKNPQLYICLMRYVYGPEAQRFAIDSLLRGQSLAFWEKAGAEYPLFEPCLFNALGVVTHSTETRAMVDRRYADLLPTVDLELPFSAYDMHYAGQPLLTRAELDLPQDKVVLVSSGRLGVQKRLDVVMRALADDAELNSRSVLVIAGGGDDDYLAYLRDLATELGLSDVLRFVVDPDDRTMHSLIAASDVAVNLRYPSTESGSASLVEQLYFGRPTIVTRVGVYDEFPDELLVKVEMADERRSLTAALRKLVLDPSARADLAAFTSKYASAHFSPDCYAESIVEFVNRVKSAKQRLHDVDEAAERLRHVPAGDLNSKSADLAAEFARGTNSSRAS